MRRSSWLGFLAALAFALAAFFAVVWPGLSSSQHPKPAAPPRDAPPARSAFEADVARVLDGDTIKLDDGREVRYIGIDCAEKGEPFADEAKARNRELVERKRLRFETDDEVIDHYGRVLAYASSPESANPASINETLVEEGLALYYPVPPNVARAPQLLAAQNRARAAHRGLWAEKIDRPEAFYLGSSDRFHRPGCEHVKDIKRPVRYETRDAALDAGKAPCRTCKP